MKKDVIHLKYPLDAKYKAYLKSLSFVNRESYSNQAKNSTLCWTNKNDINITITNDLKKVTCKKCLKILVKSRNSNTTLRGERNEK
jgi:RNase P subunit RPR2